MDLAAMQAQIESLDGQLARMQAGHAELQRQLRELRVSVSSADGLVTATVDARGQVVRIELDPRIYQRPDSRRLAATIAATIQQAAREASEQVAELLRPFVPEPVRQAHAEFDLDAVLRHRDAELLER